MRHNLGFGLTILIVIQLIVAQLFQLLASNISVYIFYVYLTLTYVIIATLISIEIDRLNEFHMEKFTLFIFILSSLVRTRYSIVGEGYFLLIIGLSGLSVVLVLVRNRSKIPQTNFKWAMAGALLGCIALIPITNIEPAQFQTALWKSALFSKNVFVGIVRQTINVLSSSAPIEEITFRGFLWGYLEKLGWKENKVVWTQGILFWLIHYFKIFSTPWTFLITVPLLALISTILVLRSKQVFPSVLSHAIINILAPLFANFIT